MIFLYDASDLRAQLRLFETRRLSSVFHCDRHVGTFDRHFRDDWRRDHRSGGCGGLFLFFVLKIPPARGGGDNYECDDYVYYIFLLSAFWGSLCISVVLFSFSTDTSTPRIRTI